MAGMRSIGLLVVVILATSACALVPPSVPKRAYYPDTADPRTKLLSESLYRAAVAAGDDPRRYSFAMLQTWKVTAVTADEGIFYFSEGLAAQTSADALVAQEVAHEVLGHAGKRRALSLGVSGGFTAIGFVVPGLGLMDFVVNPIIVRAFTRDQTLDADRKAVEILRAMEHEAPRRTLAAALRATASLNGPRNGGPLLATEPDLDDRLTALEPLESVEVAKTSAAIGMASTPSAKPIAAPPAPPAKR
jgi:predicted Zn-dependent protease